MNLNKVYLIGRLTQDPEMRATPGGQNVTTIRMATNRVWYDKQSSQKREATEFHTVIAWGRLGEIASQYLRRGSLALIEGRMQTRSWTGTQDSVKRYVTEIIAENLQLGPRSAGGEPMGAPSPARPAAGPAQDAPAMEPEIPIIDENELPHQGIEEEDVKIKPEDLPF
ncbi:MAG: single-stranded DNA-binding protein [Patescibacteria group bacterium]